MSHCYSRLRPNDMMFMEPPIMFARLFLQSLLHRHLDSGNPPNFDQGTEEFLIRAMHYAFLAESVVRASPSR